MIGRTAAPRFDGGGELDRTDERDREIADLRERLSRLNEAMLRITEDLDLDSVLREVVNSARILTSARYGVIAALDGSGNLSDVVTSGMTADEQRAIENLLPGCGPLVLEHVSGLEGPLRFSDYRGYLTSLGLPDFMSVPAGSFMTAPIRWGGEVLGAIHVAREEAGRRFSQQDEETLVMFASHAALAIANARRYRKEQRARAGLETLVNTSPVGVVVFDAGTGAIASINREAKRIVDSLRESEQKVETLLDEVTFRRFDGREVSLREFSVAEALNSGETIRAEEVVLHVPSGQSVTILLNATPIVSGAGEVESLVVTLQDMTDVEEQERMRAEFLAMVSHELRAPLTSIKGSAAAALGSTTEADPLVTRQFFRIIDDQADRMNALVSDLLDVARIEAGALPVNPGPAEVAALLDRARNAFISGGGKNHLQFDVEPNLPLVMADGLRIVQVLVNLLSNAARHSSEGGTIKVTAAREDVYVAVSVIDEGRGIPAENLPNLFRKFSSLQSEEYGGDTGLGLAICKGIVESHGGRIWAESDGPGLGARLTFTLTTAEDIGSVAASRMRPEPAEQSQRRQGQDGEDVRILAVDDDPQTLRYVRDTLIRAGYAPIVTGEREEALRVVEEKQPQLVLLDLMMPGTDGIDLMAEILELAEVPVIFLSAYGREELVAKAFDMGAVDYVVKPFSPTELAARIRAALRRRSMTEAAKPYVLGELTVDHTTRTVTLKGRPVQLMAMEYNILAELSLNAGRVLTYEHLLERVWRDRSSADLRPMRTMLSKLRAKLGDDARNPAYIFTEPRVGYRMPRGE